VKLADLLAFDVDEHLPCHSAALIKPRSTVTLWIEA
jgi:hypothetical protein